MCDTCWPVGCFAEVIPPPRVGVSQDLALSAFLLLLEPRQRSCNRSFNFSFALFASSRPFSEILGSTPSQTQWSQSRRRRVRVSDCPGRQPPGSRPDPELGPVRQNRAAWSCQTAEGAWRGGRECWCLRARCLSRAWCWGATGWAPSWCGLAAWHWLHAVKFRSGCRWGGVVLRSHYNTSVVAL